MCICVVGSSASSCLHLTRSSHPSAACRVCSCQPPMRLPNASTLYYLLSLFFFFQAEDGIRDDLVTGVQTCALPISAFAPAMSPAMSAPMLSPTSSAADALRKSGQSGRRILVIEDDRRFADILSDRKSTRLNSSHQIISYAVFCLKKKKDNNRQI